MASQICSIANSWSTALLYPLWASKKSSSLSSVRADSWKTKVIIHSLVLTKTCKVTNSPTLPGNGDFLKMWDFQ